jgi:beta-lactamase regulating signal transducer with metallopeptidase domain
MSPFIEYLLKVTIGLAAVSCFYQCVLRKYTFYNWNRWYLLIYPVLVFFIPFINIDETLNRVEVADRQIVSFMPAVQHFTRPEIDLQEAALPVAMQVRGGDILLIIFATGVILMLIRSAVFFVSLLRIRKKARLISRDGVKIYEVEKDIIPFSFGNSIFINRKLHHEHELKDIMLHEFVHVRQRHTADIIFAEILCILNWYNPFAWLIRYAIRQNLEFIADRQVLQNGVDAKHYQYLLLKVTGVPAFRIASQFNFSSLKQRIMMMNKMKSTRIQLTWFLFVLPLLFVLLVAFRQDIENQISVKEKGYVKNDQIIYISGLVLEVMTGKPISNLPLELRLGDGKTTKTISTDSDGYYYYEFDISNYPPDSVLSYGVLYEDGGEYKRFAGSSTVFYNGRAIGKPYHTVKKSGSDREGGDHFTISFLKKRDSKLVNGAFVHFVSQNDFFENNKSPDIQRSLKPFLQEESKKPLTEQNLIASFKKAYKRPRHIITKFKNGFFDQERKLVGYEGNLQFFLNGKAASYNEINTARKDGPVLLLNSERILHTISENTKMFYYTFPTSKTAPPQTLVTRNNIEWVDIKSFDMNELNNSAYFLDGFRQVFGTGSNLKPLQEEIKRVAIFKGELARYYDKNLSKLLWIETRPAEEVYERPALAAY